MSRSRLLRSLSAASIVLVGVAAGCSSTPTTQAPSNPSPTVDPGSGLPIGTLRIETDSGEVSIRVEIADTDEARSAGLMNRPSLASDRGMVFIFDEPTDGPFWMKDTLVPLSIAFWDAEGIVVRILDMEPCQADPCLLYSPMATYVGAVEVNQGWFGRNGVGPGDHVELTDGQ